MKTEEYTKHKDCSLGEGLPVTAVAIADRENALSATAFLFGREAAERVKEETENPADMLKKVFPRLNCYDCKNCPIAGLHCEYPAAAEILKKLDRAMARSSVSQEALLEKLKGLAAQS